MGYMRTGRSQACHGPARHLLTKSNEPAFSQEWASVGPCHVSTYHRRSGSNEWMTSVPTVSRHVCPRANDEFTRGKSPLVGAINGLSDPNQTRYLNGVPLWWVPRVGHP